MSPVTAPRPKFIWLLFLAFLTFGLIPPTAGSTPLETLLPPAERSFFILDVSGSTNSKQLWKESLRPSLIKKLKQPFGYPLGKGLDQKSAPVDVTVGVINDQSIDAPAFPIVSIDDARRIWGLIDKIGEGPTSRRLGLIVTDIFGGDGAFTQQARIFSEEKLVVPVASKCQKSVISSFKNSRYMNDLNIEGKNDSAETICSVIIQIAQRIDLADKYFAKPTCTGARSCSDIIGAILRTTNSAEDFAQTNSKGKFCLAIASDMLNISPSMSKSSPLNSRNIALTATNATDAKSQGAKAAELAGVKFPSGLSVRVSVLGQGTGVKPIPLEKNSSLTAYWQGFWQAAGIKSNNQVRSWNEACS